MLAASGIGFWRWLQQTGAQRPTVAAGYASVRLGGELTRREIAEQLARAGRWTDTDAAVAYWRFTLDPADVAVGVHWLPAHASLAELTALLLRSPARQTARVVLPEGFHRFAMAQRLAALGICPPDAFLRATEAPAMLEARQIDSGSLEGHLFPATYTLGRNTPAAEIVELLVKEADRRWNRLVAAHPQGAQTLSGPPLLWSRQDIITLASIVEKEAAADEERPAIASVFLNRLRDPAFTPKRLQSDPTSAYACWLEPERVAACQGFAGRPTPALNRDPANRYSTYVHTGLPPGPIANPGEASIAAVLAPADTDYFYFVAKGGGRHTFSHTLAEHNQAVRAMP